MTKPTKFVLLALVALTAVAFGIAAFSRLPVPPATVGGGFGGTPSALPIYDSGMPAFQGITKWWNTPDGQPLTPESLKGKVVLVDFWTYSCINCIRTYPFLRLMQERYADQGLVIVGVHTPEFAFEADPANVGPEIAKNGLKYPIALDPKYATWNAYGNSYWPAEYLFDRQGRLRETHFGEGDYDASEAAIRSLLAEADVALAPAGEPVATPDFSLIGTRETYFGLGRGSAFMDRTGAEGEPHTYQAAAAVAADRWTAGGVWKFEREYAEADSKDAVFAFNVQAGALHIVLSSDDGQDKRIEVSVDGGAPQEMTVNAATLYTVARFPNGGRHTVRIRIVDPGVRFYAATFS